MRTLLIDRLTAAINKREAASLTIDQVDFYIGSDMSNSELLNWVEETENNISAVTVDDVMSLCSDM